jgi:hypothetical protein
MTTFPLSTKPKGYFILILLALLLFSQATLYAGIENAKEIFIGGWGFPSGETNEKFRLNYARVVLPPTESSVRSIIREKLLVAVNLKAFYRDDHSNKKGRPIEDYLEDAEKWSERSIEVADLIVAISQDDFGNWWRKYADRDIQLIAKVSENIRKYNGRLCYGVTIYEDDLRKTPANEWVGIGKYVDMVHFYLHKRTNLGNYSEYMDRLEKYFPKAKIILGIYNYDRRSYEKRAASDGDEIKLFQRQMDKCLAIISDRHAIGIEFYPGILSDKPDKSNNYDIDDSARKVNQEIESYIHIKLQDIRK